MNDKELYALAEKLGAALKARGLMLTTAESCTGGWIAQAVTAVPGSSAWFERGFVTYTNIAKQEMLGVAEATLIAHGAVSEPVVREMVVGALTHSHAHIALSVSGVAGPGGGTPAKPVGTVYIGLASRERVVVRRFLNPYDRETFKYVTSQQAFELLRRELRGGTKPERCSGETHERH